MEALPGLENNSEVSAWDSLLTDTSEELQDIRLPYDSEVQDPLPNMWKELEELGFEVIQ